MARLDDERVGSGQAEPAQGDDLGPGPMPSASATASAAGSLRSPRTVVPGSSPCRSISRLNE